MNSNYRRIVFALVGALVIHFCAHAARSETILLFSSQPLSSESSLSTTDLATYGDRVTANIQGPNSFKYGGAANTPNIVVGFSSDERTWSSGYSDLTNVIYTPSSGDGRIVVTLTADPGSLVKLNSFDMASWDPDDYSINSVKVFDASNNAIFTQSNVLVHGDGLAPLHTSMVLPSSVVSQQLRLEIDSSNITAFWRSESICLDNLSFSQVPEPSTLGATVLLAFATGGYFKRKKARELK